MVGGYKNSTAVMPVFRKRRQKGWSEVSGNSVCSPMNEKTRCKGGTESHVPTSPGIKNKNTVM